ncbi:MAG: RsmD family RNA methyltransferase [Neomegalonema sp.]|nr:RsmD family RNA methyltransferase [Neomegalonema sp.]
MEEATQEGKEEGIAITHLGRLGDGMSAQGHAVPGALPGERVRLEADGALGAILEPSAERIKPACRHAARCGGCRLQHLAPAPLAQWKQALVASALRHRGIEAEVAPTETSPPGSRRRVAFAASRTKKGVLLGFHREGSEEIVDLAECVVARPEIMASLPALRALALIAAPRKRSISIVVTLCSNGLDIAVREAKELDLELRERAFAWVEAHGIARLAWNDEPLAQRLPPVQHFDDIAVMPPSGGFLQATAQGEARLRALALEGIAGARRVADLFAGCGTFALPAARQAQVLAVEGEAALVAALERGWREAKGLKTLKAVQRDLFRRPLLAEELAGLDAVIIDPPRAGAEAQLAQIAASGIARVVSISCNPVSFARDAAILVEGGFRLGTVTPIDQFLWSPHVEMVAVLRR